MTSDRVVLVDRRDRPVGTAGKLEAHRDGRLHRAFSVFILDPDGRMLLQRRADAKYHSGGLWSNACCSHPRPGEMVRTAARRRLRQEMGFVCDLEPAFPLLYRAEVGGGLIEHEYDHVLLGTWEGSPVPDPGEVGAWRWIDPHGLRTEVRERPHQFTAWFRLALREMEARGLIPAPVHRVA